ncbi:SURF1 family protein [Cognatiluteimonas profundi]|uniref:SURF1 family protein n=1 Tax=Cognatiluteimonas profundi TaxID=2594501 RepID=UPI00131BBE5E|nr:SURF1 family protein [Lysobacter profundi]
MRVSRAGRSRWLLWALALLVIVVFTRLGFWQLARMHEKQALLDASHAVLVARKALPLSVAADPQRATGYDWAAGLGHFSAAPAVLLDNQQHEGRVGVRAYRVFQSADAGVPPLLVDLGWLPVGGDRHMPTIALPAGEWRVAGLLAPPPSAGLARDGVAPQADGSLLTIALSITSLQRALQLPALAPRVLKLDPAQRLGYVRDLDILPNTMPPERHLGYAVQWFGLALTVLVTALVLTFRKPRTHTTP